MIFPLFVTLAAPSRVTQVQNLEDVFFYFIVSFKIINSVTEAKIKGTKKDL